MKLAAKLFEGLSKYPEYQKQMLERFEGDKKLVYGNATISLLNSDLNNRIQLDANTIMKNLAIFNPKKLQVASMLKNYHVSLGHQVLFFCDSVVPAEIYAKLLHIPFIKGNVPDAEREVIVNAFLNRQISCFMLTRVGDTSLDLPDANVLIEIDWQQGSNRQEAQRIGRISRPKSSGYCGYFYILMSSATKEISTAQSRRKYLTENQGYSYSSISDDDIIEQMTKCNVKEDDLVTNAITKQDDLYHEVLYCLQSNRKESSGPK